MAKYVILSLQTHIFEVEAADAEEALAHHDRGDSTWIEEWGFQTIEVRDEDDTILWSASDG
jgi:hypothetical protein